MSFSLISIKADAQYFHLDSVSVVSSIPNFLKVTDHIYRGGRPLVNDLADLANQLSIGTVINLENKEQMIQAEESEAKRLGISFISSPMSAQVTPSDSQVDEILNVLKDAKNFPIFIHCHHGQDRTGLIMGIYRVEVEGWNPEKAHQEMLQIGFHPGFKSLEDYFRKRTAKFL